MSLTWARLTLRLSRFEIIAFGGSILLFAVICVVAAAWFDSLRPSPGCLVPSNDGTLPPGCTVAVDAWYSATSSVLGLAAGLTIFLSFAAGIFLGVPIVAREVERGTSRLAWSLTPSRSRWFLARVVPILVVLALVTFAGGVAVERYAGAAQPEADLSNSFTLFGFRGLLVASRAVFIFAVAVLIGAIVARSLPGVILAAIIATIGIAGGEQLHQRVLAAEAIAIPFDGENGPATGPGDLFIDQKFVLSDGTLVDYNYFGDQGQDPYDLNGVAKYPMVSIVVPGERYRFVETRQAVVLAAGSLVALLLAGFAVARRRPG